MFELDGEAARPAPRFVAVVGSVLGLMAALGTGFCRPAPAEPWLTLAGWCPLNLAAVGVATLALVALARAVPDYLFRGPPLARARTLLYGSYAGAGLAAGAGHLTLGSWLGLPGGGSFTPASAASDLLTTVTGTVPVGVLATRYYGFLARVENVARHAQARRVEISLALRDGPTLELTVQDDGRGFDGTHLQRGLGLSSIDGRVSQLGGTCQIAGRPGQRTTLSARIPLAGGDLDELLSAAGGTLARSPEILLALGGPAALQD